MLVLRGHLAANIAGVVRSARVDDAAHRGDAVSFAAKNSSRVSQMYWLTLIPA
jgi:hypothetical protein